MKLEVVFVFLNVLGQWPPGHEDKLISLSGVNALELPNNWFWWVGLLVRMSLIAVRIVE